MGTVVLLIFFILSVAIDNISTDIVLSQMSELAVVDIVLRRCHSLLSSGLNGHFWGEEVVSFGISV